ncbi:hypothetical protein KP509_04G051300 [Ceratopteris richardii]|nr:hypothetical protein KP509_04G051300 [Ceratopteris richardii]
MLSEGVKPNAVTYVCILKACTLTRDFDRGRRIYEEIMKQGLLPNNVILGNALVDMYAKCSSMSEARQVLEGLPTRNVVSWNALATGYVQTGEAYQALKCLEQMEIDGIRPDAVTYTCMLKACAMIRAIGRGKQIHDEIARQELLQNDTILCNALVDMYAKCGAFSEAQQLLEELPCLDVVAWNALVAGYVQDNEAEQAMDCLEQMQDKGILPDQVTYICILKACSMIRALEKGRIIHDNLVKHGLLESDIVLGGALIDMYAKCGALIEAQEVLMGMPSRNVVVWSALITGYVQEGEAMQALECLDQMQHDGIAPDAVTCACVLNACCHCGLVAEGEALFVNMNSKYGLKPSPECYICMVDLFGRVGHLEKAVRLAQEMPYSESLSLWHMLLGACRKWVDVNVGEWAFEQAVKLDKTDGSAYVLMADVYAAAGMPEKAKQIETMRIRNNAQMVK